MQKKEIEEFALWIGVYSLKFKDFIVFEKKYILYDDGLVGSISTENIPQTIECMGVKNAEVMLVPAICLRHIEMS